MHCAGAWGRGHHLPVPSLAPRRAAAATESRAMRSINDLDADALRVAHDAAERMMSLKEYLPSRGLLLMLTTKFRDDLREALGMDRLPLPQRSAVHLSLDALTTAELDSLWGAVMILLQDRFTAIMDDPALPRLTGQLQESLTDQRRERSQIRAEMAS